MWWIKNTENNVEKCNVAQHTQLFSSTWLLRNKYLQSSFLKSLQWSQGRYEISYCSTLVFDEINEKYSPFLKASKF